MMDKPTEMPMPAWGYYFIVDDIDAACRRVKDGGGTIVEEPMDVPAGFAAQARDPQGAWFGLAGPRIAK
jgi:predicted enzyme related to lactoylglutathione lyase